MKPLELALKYMEIFCSGKNLERLYEMFSYDLKFEGPLYTFDSAFDYVQSLINDPPTDSEYKIIEIFEKKNSVNLIYEFKKYNISTIMSQYFEIKNNKIIKIILIFDSVKFCK
jgi:hypothetical protein